MQGTLAIRHPFPIPSFTLGHRCACACACIGGWRDDQSFAQNSPSTCTTFFLPRCAPASTGTSSRSPQATAQSAR